MADPIYKQFAVRGTVFCLFFAALFLIFCSFARAETNPAYTVEGVEVDVTAENAVKAREKALDEAQVKAYQMLTERFLGAEAVANAPAPDPITVSSLVQDYEVTNEQLSTTRYKGVFTVRFRPNAMKSQMAAKGISYTDTPQKPVLILPFFQNGARTALWSDANPWMQAWRNLPSDKSMMQPIVLPLGDVEDMQQVGDDDALNYDPTQVQALAARYGADDIALLLASAEPVSATQGRLVINLYNNGFEGPQFVQKIAVDQNPGEAADALFTRAAIQVKGLLRQNWKANAAYNPAMPPQPPQPTSSPQPNSSPYPAMTMYQQQTANAQQPRTPPASVPYTRPALGPSTLYPAQVRFASVQDWVRMKNTMDRIYGMQAVVIKSLKPREALIDLRFAGNVSSLQLALQNAGIMMRAGQGGVLQIYPSANPSTVYGQ